MGRERERVRVFLALGVVLLNIAAGITTALIIVSYDLALRAATADLSPESVTVTWLVVGVFTVVGLGLLWWDRRRR
jgi:lipopolysaccharide export LptBFGC system permease protein LptF